MAAVVCAVCGKEFRYEAWLRKHAVQHQAQELPCIQPGCTRRFKSRDALRSHVKTQHQDQYRHRCPVCRKGFQDRQKMQAHHREHGGQDGPAQQAAGAVLGQEVVRLLQLQVMRPTSPPPSLSTGRRLVACAACQRRAERDDFRLFECSACHKFRHWTCAGLAGAPQRPMPQPTCPVCLVAQGRRPAALAQAALGRAMCEAFVAQQGHAVVPMPADGWCLVAAVAQRLSMERLSLLQQALATVAGLDALASLPEAAQLRAEAQQLLRRGDGIGRHMGSLWSSRLWDLLPQALSVAVNRPLHILQGQVAAGQVGLTVIDQGNRAAEPVRLLRSGDEYGCAHYDLIT